MTCIYCHEDHSALYPCPEMMAVAQATVQKHTLGTRDPVTIRQLDESIRIVENLIKAQRWVLISPDGDMWAEYDAKKLIAVLLTKMR